ncbi:hydrogen peroxide-inducible genes activator [Lentisalinibacter sediminis]|uniref:hydrogen peroxide-inducible genes activator n=1 Tax=Lentisalinibacter sediminis TaxID=2992237 RepID=UPI003864F5C5
MAINLPSVKQLRYFVALAEHGHFGRAADACHVSQSAFSVGIQELEAALDVQLVDRTNRQVTITAIGREVAEQARLCLRDLESLVQMARVGQKPLSGPLRLGVIPTISPFLLPRVLPLVRRSFPELKLFLVEDLTDKLHHKLLAGDIDLMLFAVPYELRNVETEPLYRDRFLLAAHRETRLVDPENYRYNRLHADSVLLLEEGHCLREHAIDACRIRSSEKVSRFAATSLLTLIEMVDADLGITFLPEMARDSALLSATDVGLWPMGERSYREIALGWRRGSARADEFRELGAFITDNRQP